LVVQKNNGKALLGDESMLLRKHILPGKRVLTMCYSVNATYLPKREQ